MRRRQPTPTLEFSFPFHTHTQRTLKPVMPPTTYYPLPSRTLPPAAESLTLARHTPCSNCACPGLRPPPGSEPQAKAASTANFDDVGWHWACACDCEAGHEREEGSDERSRRARVASRIDELLQVSTGCTSCASWLWLSTSTSRTQDEGKLLDFEHEDDDLLSLRK